MFLPPQHKNAFTLCLSTIARYLINIATCCEGIMMKTRTKSSSFFRMAASPCGCFLSFNIAMLQLENISHQVQQSWFDCTSCPQHSEGQPHHTFPFSPVCLLNAATWQAARDAPRINVNSRAMPVMDASSDVLTALFAVS